MFDAVCSSENDVSRRFAAHDMHGHFDSSPLRFLDRSLDLFETVKISLVVGNHLYHARPVVDIRSDRLSDLLRAVCIDVFHPPMALILAVDRGSLATIRSDDFP